MASISHPAPPGADAPKRAPTRRTPASGVLHEAGGLAIFGAGAIKALPGSVRFVADSLLLSSLLVRRTFVLMLAMNMFLGVSAANFGYFFLRSIGAGDFAAVFSGLIGPRQLATTMFGYVFSASVGCAIAAELGSAKIQQEIDAYEVQGIDPMQFLVGTRVIAVLIYVPFAAMVCLMGQFLGSYIDIVMILQGNTSQTFIDVNYSIQNVQAQLYCLLTIAAIAVPCTIVGCYFGLNTRGGPASVGNAAARSLVWNLVLVHVIATVCGVFFYGADPQIPIGG